MPFDSVIRNGRVVLPSTGVQEVDLAIQGDRIAAHLQRGTEVEARQTIDAAGKVVLPGAIDAHTHLGFGDPETDYLTETRAAALHGVTTLLNFLMSTQSYDGEYQVNRQRADAQAYVDYALHAVASTSEQLQEVGHYIRDYGITSFKFFMSFRGEEGSYLGLTPIDDGFMYELFAEMGRRPGTVVCVHTENIEVAWKLRDRLQQSGRDDLKAWHEARPSFIEAEAALRAMTFARETGCALYIVHTSTRETLEEVRRFRDRYDRIFIETCPHYLTHTYDSPVGTLGKQNPPLRAPEDVEALWEAIADGTVTTIGSDHAPRLWDRKQGTIWTASPGQPNMPLILPVLLSEGVHRRGLPLERVAEVTAANPARIFGLWPQKGSLRPGADADLAIVDMDKEVTVRTADLQSRADYSIYDGWTFKGWPVLTMLRGQVVAQDGQVMGSQGYGRFIKRSV